MQDCSNQVENDFYNKVLAEGKCIAFIGGIEENKFAPVNIDQEKLKKCITQMIGPDMQSINTFTPDRALLNTFFDIVFAKLMKLRKKRLNHL